MILAAVAGEWIGVRDEAALMRQQLEAVGALPARQIEEAMKSFHASRVWHSVPYLLFFALLTGGCFWLIRWSFAQLSRRRQALEEMVREKNLAMEQKNTQMRALVQHSERLNRLYTCREVIETIGKGALALSKADRLAIVSWGTQGEVCCTWTHNLSDAFLRALMDYAQETYHSGKIFTAWEESGEQPIRIADLHQLEESHPFRRLAGIGGFRGCQIWPLIYENRVSALMCCIYDQPAQWNDSEEEILGAFYRQAAAALETSKLFEAEQQQRRLAEALHDITSTLTSTLVLDEVFDRLLSNLSKVVPHDTSDILLFKDGRLSIARISGTSKELTGPLEQRNHAIEGLPLVQKIIETREPIVIPSTNDYAPWVHISPFEWIKSYASAPIIQHGQVIGLINVFSRQAGFFQLATGRLLKTFASQAAIAIQNASLYQQTRQRMNDTRALYRALQPLFHPGEDSRELAQEIADAVTQEFAASHCSILLLDNDRTCLKMAAQSGWLHLDAPRLDLNGRGLTVSAARTGNTVYCPDVVVEPNYVPGSAETRSELAIPLNTGGQIIGVLNLESSSVDAFDKRSRALLAAFAERAALGLENARLFDAVRQHAAEIKQLNEINQTALRMTDSSPMLHELARLAAGLINADGCYITLWDESSKKTIPYAAFGPNQEIYPTLKPQPGEKTLTYSVLQLEQALVAEDVHGSPYIDPDLAESYPVQSLLALPLIEAGVKMGCMLVGFVHSHHFTAAEIALCEQAAGQIALAIAKNRSLDMAYHRAEEAENLRQATASLGACLEPRQLLNHMLDHLERVIQHDSASIFLLEDEVYLRAWAVKNLNHPEEVLDRQFPLSNELFHEIEQTLAPLAIDDVQADPRFEAWGGMHNVRSWLGMPLIASNQFIGVLTLDRLTVLPFQAEEVELAQEFAGQAAIAVRNAQVYSAVQYLAVTDPLTDVYNRRGFFARAQALVDRCRELRQPVSAIMLDIDFFKQINDQYGHDAGDVVLQTLAERVKISIRDEDLACRYGGEEFAVLLACSDQEVAQLVANRLHENITSKPIATPSGPVYVTVSIGYVTIDEPVKSPDVLLKLADQALYLAKQKGRNQVYPWKE